MLKIRTFHRLLHNVCRNGFKSLNDTSQLSEEQIQIQSSALAFAIEKIQPFAAEWDQKQHFPKDLHKEAAQQGYAAIYTSPDYGGCGLDRLTTSIIFEALAYGCVPTSAYLSIHNMCSWMIDEFGNEEQKQRLLPPMAVLDLFSSYCLTEPNSGSDSRSMKSFAKKDGDDYILNGSKVFISGGSMSDIYVVMCKTSEKDVSVLIVEKGMKGLSFGKKEKKMGWNTSPTTMVMFEDVRVPKANLLGKEGEGFKIAMKGLDGGRVNIASTSLGGAQHAYDRALQYTSERKQFGKLLNESQYLQFKMADMATSLVSSRLMLRNAARMLDINHPDKTMYAAMAKRYVTDTASGVADYALQLHGGYGYLADYHVERIVRDLRVNQILEGTNEMMRLIISRNLNKQ